MIPQRFRSPFLLAPAGAALAALVVASALQAQTKTTTALRAHDEPRVVAVAVDSMTIHVAHQDTISGVFVETTDGTFRLRADSATLAHWADSAAVLPEPTRVPSAEGGPPHVTLRGVMLREAGNATAMRLIRLASAAGDSAPVWELDASNGAWGGALRLTPALAARLFDALRGTVAPTPEDSAHRAWLPWQVTEQAKRLSGPKLVFPPDVDARERNASVYLSFVVAPDGHVEPSSLSSYGDPIPQLALAARDYVFKSRFQPAKKDGVVVRQIVRQSFGFRE